MKSARETTKTLHTEKYNAIKIRIANVTKEVDRLRQDPAVKRYNTSSARLVMQETKHARLQKSVRKNVELLKAVSSYADVSIRYRRYFLPVCKALVDTYTLKYDTYVRAFSRNSSLGVCVARLRRTLHMEDLSDIPAMVREKADQWATAQAKQRAVSRPLFVQYPFQYKLLGSETTSWFENTDEEDHIVVGDVRHHYTPPPDRHEEKTTIPASEYGGMRRELTSLLNERRQLTLAHLRGNDVHRIAQMKRAISNLLECNSLLDVMNANMCDTITLAHRCRKDPRGVNLGEPPRRTRPDRNVYLRLLKSKERLVKSTLRLHKCNERLQEEYRALKERLRLLSTADNRVTDDMLHFLTWCGVSDHISDSSLE